MKTMKWHLCRGGYHLWPHHLKHITPRCCGEHAQAEDTHVPDYVCTSGKHLWSRSEEAECCCNGFVPVWQTMGDAATKDNPFELRQRVLVPTAAVMDMDDLASVHGETPHLYLPM